MTATEFLRARATLFIAFVPPCLGQLEENYGYGCLLSPASLPLPSHGSISVAYEQGQCSLKKMEELI